MIIFHEKIPLQIFFILYHTDVLMSIIFCKRMCPILTAAEGYVLGVGANMFKIAGPVIVYGTVASVVYGIIYWLVQMI